MAKTNLINDIRYCQTMASRYYAVGDYRGGEYYQTEISNLLASGLSRGLITEFEANRLKYEIA